MAHYKIIISYDGTDLHGFQRQLNNRTAQGEIEKALLKLGWPDEGITAAGRTDSGVHAEGQVGAFDLDWHHSDEELLEALNFHLPADISIKRVNTVRSDFHPRFDAKSRTYRYQIYVSPFIEPLLERYHWRIWPKPDFKMMNEAAEIYVGVRDYKFYGKPAKEGGITQRIVKTVKWRKGKGNKAYLKIEANSFLYHMVRRVTLVLIRYGQGKVRREAIVKSFKGADNLPTGIAPAKGLILEKITY
jgi:tRNA pseudouridine38-40 synthase